MIGQNISHYKILEKLGEGGMGVVYKAQDTKLDRFVALKFLPQHLTANEAEKTRFLQEARAASALNHPNVCTIYGIEDHEGPASAGAPAGRQQFIEMEFVDGSTLRRKFEAASLSINDVLAFSIQIGEALHEAHGKGIVHRDIKSDNIMINAKNQVKVMDFGLAKLKGSMKLTRTSSTVGTLAYMAPEQIQGGEVDARSDVFSYGVVIYEMLTGHLPFRGEHEAAMVYSILNENPEAVEKYRTDASPILVNLILRALEKDPGDRYQSAHDMVIELRRLQKQTSKVVHPSAAHIQAYRGASPVEFPASEASSRQEIPSTAKITVGVRKRVMTISAFMVMVAAVFGIYQFFLKESSTQSQAPSFQSMKITRLTSNGKARNAAISADGRYVVYASEEAGRQSLWMRQVATGSNVQIVPPDEVIYMGLTLSRDGDYVYYVVRHQQSGKFAVHQVPVLGGSSRKLLEDVQSRITLSPDGKRFAFTRYYANTGDFSLMVANIDGTGEKTLASHRGDLWLTGAPAWSPDGKVIACALGSWEGGFHHSVVAIQVDGGHENRITSHRWENIDQMQWLSNGAGLLLTGLTKGSSNRQIWQITYGSGIAARVTNDLSEYYTLDLTGDSQAFCVVAADRRSSVWVLTNADVTKGEQISAGKYDGMGGVAWAPDGRIVYTSETGGHSDLWIMDRNGANQRQLTNDEFSERNVAVSRDGKYIFFVSDRSGIPNIWRIELDGSGAKQITTGGEDYDPDVSPDNKWVVFDSWDLGPLLAMKTSIDGGQPVQLTPINANNPVVSPDGRDVAYVSLDEERNNMRRVDIIPFEGGKAHTSFDLPSSADDLVHWSKDGRALMYIDTRNGISNIWSRPLQGGAARQITSFKENLIDSFSWSAEGRVLAVVRLQISSDVLLMTAAR